MKKITIILLAFVTLLLTQCKPDPVEDNKNNEEKVRVTCAIPMNDGDRSDFTNLLLNGKVNWSDGRECVYVAVHGQNPQIIELESHAYGNPSLLEFSGEAAKNLIKSGEKYDVWYFGHSQQLGEDSYMEIVDEGSMIEGSIGTQSGRIEDVGYCHIAKTTVTANEENGEIKLNLTGTLVNQIAIALLDLENVNSLYGDAIVGTEYSLAYNETSKKYELNVMEDNDATINVESATGISYVVLMPNDNTNSIIKCTKDSKVYGVTFYDVIKANNVYFKTAPDGNTVEVLEWKFIENEEKPILLSASKTNIVANGTDRVDFTVMQNGNNVTNESSIFVGGNKINGSSFSTLTPGTYVVYAEKNGIRSNEISIVAEQAPDTGKTVVFAEGVSPTSGWYDVNKKGTGVNGDINMCWAASASNIIQWWQDRYVAKGNALPSGAITGAGSTGIYSDLSFSYQLALMDLFHQGWDNSNGGSVSQAVTWYFEGRDIMNEMSVEYTARPLSGYSGGYFKDIWNSQILPNTYHEYEYVVIQDVIEYNDLISQEFLGYSTWQTSDNCLKTFSDMVVEYISRGVTSLTISLSPNGGLLHATTLWGYEIDNTTGLLTKIWITDSDDMETEPKTAILHECTVSYDSARNKVKFNGIPRYESETGGFYASSLSPVSAYGSR